MGTPDPILLGDEGQILLTHAAIREYAEYARMQLAEAQRELLLMLCDAGPVDVHAAPEKWRYRNRTRRIDITARVLRETIESRDGSAWLLFTVVAISCRHYARPSGGKENR